MKKILTVAKWEFFEKVKTRSFIISLFVTPAIILGFSVVPALLAGREADTTEAVGIVDPTEMFFDDLRKELEQYRINDFQPAYILVNIYYKQLSLAELKKKADSLVTNGNLEGVLFLRQANGNYSIEYRSMNAGNLKDTKRFEKAFNKIKIKRNLLAAGVDVSSFDNILQDAELKHVKLDKSGKESSSGFIEVFFSSLVFIMLLAFVILSSGGMLIRSVVEEKSNRLIEILVSSCTPEELLSGKILGLSALALFQLLIWGAAGVALAGNNIIPVSAFENIFAMIIYFILGFFLYTALFVGIGSVVTTEQEAQQVTGYLSLMLLLPMIFSISTIENPNSGLVKILTYIPFTTPTVMLLKLNIKAVSIQELVLTISLLVFTIGLIIIFTAKIFRIGILSYGKAPSLHQLIQWMKEK